MYTLVFMKDRVISIRVSEEEHNHFAQLAEKDQRTLSDYVRILLTSKKQKRTSTKKKEEPTPEAFRNVWWDHWGRKEPSGMRNRQLKELYRKTVDYFPDEQPEVIFQLVINYIKQDHWYQNQDVNIINQKYGTIIKEIQRKQQDANQGGEDIFFTEDDFR